MRIYTIAFWLGIAVGRQVPIVSDVNVGPTSTEIATSMHESPNLFESIDKLIAKSAQDAHETQESPNLFEAIDKMIAKSAQDAHETQESLNLLDTIDKMTAKSAQDAHETQHITASERQAAIKQNRKGLEPVDPVEPGKDKDDKDKDDKDKDGKDKDDKDKDGDDTNNPDEGEPDEGNPDEGNPDEGLGNFIDVKKKGDFLKIKSDTGAIKRFPPDSSKKTPVKQLLVKIEDILSISEKSEKPDVDMTLKNGNEFLFEKLIEPSKVFDKIRDKMLQVDDDAEDEG